MATLKNTKLSDAVPERVDGVAPGSDGNVALGAVRFNTAQTLSDAQKEQARANIAAAAAEHTHSSVTDGDTTLSAVNGGTATITRRTGLSATHEPSGATAQFENTLSELVSGVSEGIRFKFTFNGTTYDCEAPLAQATPSFTDYHPISGGPWSGAEGVEFSTSGLDVFFGSAIFAPWTTTEAGAVITKNVATADQIPTVPDLDLSIVNGKLCVTFEE